MIHDYSQMSQSGCKLLQPERFSVGQNKTMINYWFYFVVEEAATYDGPAGSDQDARQLIGICPASPQTAEFTEEAARPRKDSQLIKAAPSNLPSGPE